MATLEAVGLEGGPSSSAYVVSFAQHRASCSRPPPRRSQQELPFDGDDDTN